MIFSFCCFGDIEKGYITYHLLSRLLDHAKPYLVLEGITESYPKILDFTMNGIGLSLLGRSQIYSM